MPAETVNGKYVFMDVVGFSKNRTVEAQYDIISRLNEIVRHAVSETEIREDDYVYIPTGDGLCIGMLDVHRPFDLHMTIALKILEGLDAYNKSQTDNMRKFGLRIGINEHVDNLVHDINGHRNIAGAGVVITQHIMQLGDAGNIVVGPSVFERLSSRERYHGKFRRRTELDVSGEKVPVFQYVDPALHYLNSELPSSIRNKNKKKKLTMLIAYLVGNMIKYRDEILKTYQKSSFLEDELFLTMINIARECESRAMVSEFDKPAKYLPQLDEVSIENYAKYYASSDACLKSDYVRLFKENYISEDYADYFDSRFYHLEITQEGIDALKAEWTPLVEELGIASKV